MSELEELAAREIAKKATDREANRRGWPETAIAVDVMTAASPIPTRVKVIYAIENGKQIGKPDAYSLAPDDPRWTR